MAKNKYIVFIPKYEYTIENQRAVKKVSEASLSIKVESDNIQEAVLKVLVDFDSNQLQSAGYCVDEIKVMDDLGDGQEMQVFIKGVNKK